MKRRASAASWLVAGGCALVLAVATPASGEPTVPNTFSGGTPISAAQVNQNFQALAAAMPSANYLYNYNNGPLSETPLPIIGMTITPPADGAVLVSTGAIVTITQTAVGNDVVLLYLDSTGMGSPSSGQLALNTTGAHAETLQGRPMASWLFPVKGGEAITFTAEAFKTSGTNGATYTQPWMTAVFVPGRLPCAGTVHAMSEYGCSP